MKGLLEKQGVKVIKDGKLLSEIWFRAEMPAPKPTSEQNISMPNVPHGSLLGVIKVEQTDRTAVGRCSSPGCIQCGTPITRKMATIRARRRNGIFAVEPGGVRYRWGGNARV